MLHEPYSPFTAKTLISSQTIFRIKSLRKNNVNINGWLPRHIVGRKRAILVNPYFSKMSLFTNCEKFPKKLLQTFNYDVYIC